MRVDSRGDALPLISSHRNDPASNSGGSIGFDADLQANAWSGAFALKRCLIEREKSYKLMYSNI